MKTKTLLQRVLEEKIVVGGILYTREGLYKEMRKDGASTQKADYFAFATPTATEEDILTAINTVPNEYGDDVAELLGRPKRNLIKVTE